MKPEHGVDVKENELYAIDAQILRMLLKDRTTRKNILWATDDYVSYGAQFASHREITVTSITGKYETVLRPRVEKTKAEQATRAKERAEVFTPAWVCNKQNNLVDCAWFGREGVFNTETERGWVTTPSPIVFPNTKGKTWQDYVKANRLEITCGEAPYLASRYDAVTGVAIPVTDRIGLLDRKLRVVAENCETEPEFYTWAVKALQSVYGFDWQGDNVLLARENLFFTFFDHYEHKFEIPPVKEYLLEVAKILSWNIWQMDGIKFVIPNSCHDVVEVTQTFFGDETTIHKCPGCQSGEHHLHNGIYARIYDWSANHSIEFYSLVKGGARHGQI